MNRQDMLHQLADTPEWDIVIIGGGATGLGAAVDASSRGYKILLVEQYDFSKGTSSRSTKLVHGGVRYLEQGNLKLVKEALRERKYLLGNAPHLTSVQPFIVPVFSWWQKLYYAVGLKIYDLLADKFSLGKTQVLSKKQTLAKLPGIDPSNLSGGILYYDGQFDDSRLCTDLAATAAHYGAALLTYCKATGFMKSKEKINGVHITDTVQGKEYSVRTKAVINATGVFTDSVMQMDDAARHNVVSPSQGIHLVVDASFFPGTNAMMIPKTDDGRVLFAVPWHNKIVLGTTDTPVSETLVEPRALEEEIAFILEHINRYGTAHIERKDVKSVFAGLRPLVSVQGPKRTALLSRDHTLLVAPSGLVTITGGKWTTYRKMAEEAVDNALFVCRLDRRECRTKELPIGNEAERATQIAELAAEDSLLREKLHVQYPYTRAEVLYAVRYEMAIMIEDVLARRTRLLFLDAAAAMEAAPVVASIMSKELGKDKNWEAEQLSLFETLAKQYLLS
ncbi:MAG: glycerol-3-phosphate dehydrogenase/oxidase [Sediminibacterium sp.]|nr:glycerol-3-phosphate dehydrogenase/oxidase [Sediminibacterium sp.]